jgi:hypothetical protein
LIRLGDDGRRGIGAGRGEDRRELGRGCRERLAGRRVIRERLRDLVGHLRR